ncbi:MerR family DNA-binding transcriptional regulator [Geodermatophilus sp. SYSU D00708]
MAADLVRIGQVAERTGLSLRTIRFYEELAVAEDVAGTLADRLVTEGS